MKELNSDEWAKARRLAGELAASWFVIQPSDVLRARATRLVDLYDLRAADALQLAAALEWSAGVPHGKKFLATDQKLLEAAILTGFEVERL
jgi:predicted nucleic acid-binding protein